MLFIVLALTQASPEQYGSLLVWENFLRICVLCCLYSSEWVRKMCGFFQTTSRIEFNPYVVKKIYNSFIFIVLCSLLLYEYTTVYVAIFLLMGIGFLVSGYYEQWCFEYSCTCLLVPILCHWVAKWLSYRMGIFLVPLQNARLFSSGVVWWQ